MTAFDDLLASPGTLMRYGTWLADLMPEDATGTPETIRVSVRPYATAGTDSPAHTPYEPRLLSGLKLDAVLWAGEGGGVEIGGGSVPTDAALVLMNPDGRFDRYRPSAGYRWDGRAARVRFGSGTGRRGPGFLPFADFRAWYLEMGEPVFALDRVTIPLRGLDARFDAPLQVLRYRGTGGVLNFAAAAYSGHGTPAKLDLTGSMCFEAWVRVDNLAATRNLAGWNAGFPTRLPWQVRVNTSGKLVLAYTHGAGTAATHASTVALTVGRWYQVAVAIAGTAGMFVVYDGSTGVETVESFTLAAATRDARNGTAFQVSMNHATQSWVGDVDEVRVWTGTRTLAEIRTHRHQEIEVVPAALVGYWRANDGGLSVTLTDAAASPADGALSGTTLWLPSFEGEAGLAGQPKPDALGRTDYREPVMVARDLTGVTYQVAEGAVQAIVPYVGLEALTGGSDIASERTFAATTPAAGSFRTHLARGLVKLGVASKPVTCIVSGYASAGDTKADLIRWMVTTRGTDPLADPAELDTASFSTLDTADDSVHGLAIREERTIRDLLDFVAGPGCWWGYDFDSDLFGVHQWTGPAETADLVLGPESIISVEPVSWGARAYHVDLGIGQVREHSDDEISASAAAGAAQRARTNGGWSLVPADDPDALVAHPRAASMRFDTAAQLANPAVSYTSPQGRDAAGREAWRILALLASDWEAWRFVFTPAALGLRLGSTVAPIVRTGQTVRMGFDGTRNLSVLAIKIDPVSWKVEVVCVG